jgi:addiction module HigA family antidote
MMKSPPHPGQGLKDEIEALGLSIAEFAKALGVTRQQLYRVINGDCGITPEMALRLEMAIGGSADFWLRLQMNYDLAQIRNRPGLFKLNRLARPEVV